MASDLSSNWKKLQATIKGQGSSHGQKRKVDQAGIKPRGTSTPAKKAKLVHGKREFNKPDSIANRASATKYTSQAPIAAKPGIARAIARQFARISEDSKTTTQIAVAKAAMGATHSQTSQPGISASLALWAEDNDISTESISEAYGLGSKNNSMLTTTAERLDEGLAKDVIVGKYIAVDCEMVGVGDRGAESALARVSIVDFHGQQVYESYVRPKEKVVDWRTWVSGVAPKHMVRAREFEEVQAEVAQLFAGRIVVGHDLNHDLQALKLDHPRKDIRDTSRFSGFRKYGHGPRPGLKVLARELLQVTIQSGKHSSIEDARVAMLLFRMHKPAFDVEHAAHHPEPVLKASVPKLKPKKKTKKKRRN